MAMKSAMKSMKKMNEYFTMVQEARTQNKASFVYKGNTYVAKKTKTGTFILGNSVYKGSTYAAKKRLMKSLFPPVGMTVYAKKK